jgi:hypothetical protein
MPNLAKIVDALILRQLHIVKSEAKVTKRLHTKQNEHQPFQNKLNQFPIFMFVITNSVVIYSCGLQNKKY